MSALQTTCRLSIVYISSKIKKEKPLFTLLKPTTFLLLRARLLPVRHLLPLFIYVIATCVPHLPRTFVLPICCMSCSCWYVYFWQLLFLIFFISTLYSALHISYTFSAILPKQFYCACDGNHCDNIECHVFRFLFGGCCINSAPNGEMCQTGWFHLKKWKIGRKTRHEN